MIEPIDGRERPFSGAAPAVVRAASVLDALAHCDAQTLSLAELARELELPKSSLSSICSALESADLIRREDGRYGLGHRLVELGGAYLSRMDVVSEFYQQCQLSPVLCTETVRLSAAAGIDNLVMARYEGHPAIRVTSGIGDRLPASANAMGKALLARLDDAEIVRLYHGIAELPRLTSRSLTSLSDLLTQIRQIRLAGYAVDMGEFSPNIVGIAVVVPPRGSHSPLLAVGTTLHENLADEPRRQEMAGALQALALKLGNPMEPSRSALQPRRSHS